MRMRFDMNDPRPQEKKIYTVEDHLKYISFGIKDLVAAVNKIASALEKTSEFDPPNF